MPRHNLDDCWKCGEVCEQRKIVCWEQFFVGRCRSSTTCVCLCDCHGRLFFSKCNIVHTYIHIYIYTSFTTSSTYSPSSIMLPRNGDSGSVVFSDIIEILESDDRVTTRHMNHDGSFYFTEEAVYDDDSISFDLRNSDENGMSFLDALEDEIEFDDMIGDNTNQFHRSNR